MEGSGDKNSEKKEGIYHIVIGERGGKQMRNESEVADG